MHPKFTILIAAFSVSLMNNVFFGQKAFTEISEKAGIYFDFVGYHYGGGIAVGDFNNDGFEDLYISNGKGLPNALYLNNGDETFTETAHSAGVADTSEGMGVVCGDLDNDGDVDIFLSNHFAENKLYLNDGNAHFADVTAAAGLNAAGPGTSVALADYDLDGWLDIYVLHHAQDHLNHANTLYRNNGDVSGTGITFSDVTEESGAGSDNTALAVGFFDFNNDMYPDIYVVNEYDRDEVILNNGDGTFTNLKEIVKIPSGGGMGVDFADYDNDGDIDVYVTNLYRDFLLRNDEGKTLTDVTSQAGIENLTMGWGASFLDYDNDGDRDIHVVNGAMLWPANYDETNVFFRNNGNGFFNQVAAELGLDTRGDSRASACGDFNNDGYFDLVELNVDRENLRLYKNNSTGNNWITLKLVGTRSNRNGIGAKVEITAGSKNQVQEIRSGSSYASNHSFNAAFGLKKADRIDKITVYWPSGEIQELTDQAVNQKLIITEPGGENGNSANPAMFILYQNFPNPFNPATEIPYRLNEAGDVTIEIINIAGQAIRRFHAGGQTAGDYTTRWDGRNQTGIPVSAGVYIYRFRYQSADGVTSLSAKKMILIR